jgi:hypothetical protein
MRKFGILSVLAAPVLAAGLLVAGSSSAWAADAASTGTGSVSGTVTDAATSSPLAGICVNVVEEPNTSAGTSAATKKNGVWTLSGIAPGTDYTAFAYDCKGGNYVGQWFDDQQFQANATQFSVSAGHTSKGVDFSLSLGGAVSGKVTDSETKSPVQGILVIAYWTDAEQTSTFAACTTSKGTYKLKGVPTSGAEIEFLANDCGVSSAYDTIWYHNEPNYAAAKVVAVTAGATTTGINQALTASPS